jgi:hypothetical protein
MLHGTNTNDMQYMSAFYSNRENAKRIGHLGTNSRTGTNSAACSFSFRIRKELPMVLFFQGRQDSLPMSILPLPILRRGYINATRHRWVNRIVFLVRGHNKARAVLIILQRHSRNLLRHVCIWKAWGNNYNWHRLWGGKAVMC